MSYATIVLFSAAITVVFVRGSIFDPLRKRGPELWRDLVKCPLCSGVWVGGLAYLGDGGFYIPYAGVWPWFSLLFTTLGLGALTGCAALLFVRVWDALESFAVLLELEAESRKRWEEQVKAREDLRAARAAAVRAAAAENPP